MQNAVVQGFSQLKEKPQQVRPVVGASNAQVTVTRQNPVRASLIEFGIRGGGLEGDHQRPGAFSRPNTGGSIFKNDAFRRRNTQ